LNVLLKKRISRYLTVLATITLITACSTTSTTPPEDIPPAVFSELEAGSAFYLLKDQQLGSETNLIWQFLAAQALIGEKKFVMADAVMDSLQTKVLSAQQSALLTLLMADSFYAQNKLSETQSALSDTDATLLKPSELMHFLTLQSTVYIRHDLPLQATNTLLLLAPRLTVDEEKQTINDLLLDQLTLLSSEQLHQYQVTSPTSEAAIATDETLVAPANIDNQASSLVIDQEFKAGWYALAAIYQKSHLRPNLLQRLLTRWKMTYPTHEALNFMPFVLTNIAELSPYQPENIALLLPLSGRYERQGKAIQLGLISAYYQQQASLNETEKRNVPQLHFFDTQVGNSEQLTAQLKKANIDFVVGPLLKKEIESLLPLIEEMPVLTFNSLPKKAMPLNTESQSDVMSQESIAWHYAFPLSPEDEAKQAATMIHAEQHSNPLIIVPDSNYGRRVAQAFKAQWSHLTPDSDIDIEAHYFQSKTTLATFIGDLLHTDKSKSRIQQMKAITQIPLETEVRSRRDVDAIYIVSKRDELILLKPFIDVSVSPFAQKIPLYASSRSHSLDRNNMQNKELSGLTFSDSPFLLHPDSALNKEIEASWNKQSFSTLRLFSLGFDSYQLIEQLIYLQNSEHAVYKGLIGDLKLNKDNNVEATLSWAKYQNGALFEIATPITAE